MLALALNMVSSLGLAEWMRLRFDTADKNRSDWEREYEREKGTHGIWPYTKGIERVSLVLRYLKILLPLASGFMLILGVFSQK